MNIAERLMTYLRTEGPAFLLRAGTALAILIVAVMVARVAAKFVRRAMASTGASAFSTFIPGFLRAAIVGIGLVMALDQLGVDVNTLLAGAGVVGLAIGFGSQTVVRDVVTGFFFVVDGALLPGDKVKIGDSAGTVENIGLRMTEIRGESGEVFYIANGTIGTISNKSRQWARITIELPIPHDRDLKKEMSALSRILSQFATELEPAIVGTPEALGVVELDAERALVRLVADVKAGAYSEARRALLRRIRDDYYRPLELARIAVADKAESQGRPADGSASEGSKK
ncbi:MAG: mechanosensitive ion channel [Myxococcales bacterium]|nr:mechanosensitive ion channel [Myxococcales bacterium]